MAKPANSLLSEAEELIAEAMGTERSKGRQ